jgi:ABC-type Fe3+ transport system substrate-binding protein
MIEWTYSGAEPFCQRWQDGYEIPVNVTTEEHDGRPRWVYQRVVTPALTTIDIWAAVERDFGADPEVYAQAIAAAQLVLLA